MRDGAGVGKNTDWMTGSRFSLGQGGVETAGFDLDFSVAGIGGDIGEGDRAVGSDKLINFRRGWLVRQKASDPIPAMTVVVGQWLVCRPRMS